MQGSGISGKECRLLVRAGGKYLPARCLALDPAVAARASAMGLELASLELPPELEPGVIYIEVQKGT